MWHRRDAGHVSRHVARHLQSPTAFHSVLVLLLPHLAAPGTASLQPHCTSRHTTALPSHHATPRQPTPLRILKHTTTPLSHSAGYHAALHTHTHTHTRTCCSFMYRDMLCSTELPLVRKLHSELVPNFTDETRRFGTLVHCSLNHVSNQRLFQSPERCERCSLQSTVCV